MQLEGLLIKKLLLYSRMENIVHNVTRLARSEMSAIQLQPRDKGPQW